ncbi:MAG: hypothetical protein KBG28_22980 [Kofleriaceae bacterium]|jgi:hypothetical protein|nr:hypothetical protein [Kofleriaceae bacterium]MBP6837491.1 hypothetical protein [Kofleriaceae bacterium]MBP9206855.1 hypothetical protein [Kofleriaceae bacterium]
MPRSRRHPPLLGRAWIVGLSAWLVLGLLAGPARAQDDFFNSSPGPLAASHAELDTSSKCNDCHDGGREVIASKCLGCHDHRDLKARIDGGKGFHSSAIVKGKACEACHAEHKGKSKDIMGWHTVKGGEKGFNHELTGWPLGGKHAEIECVECHKNKNRQGLRTYLGEDKLCGSCHKDDQPHKFERREMLACERCHGESTWKTRRNPLKFDHNDKRDAAMPTNGRHEDLACSKCHPKAVFNLPAPDPDSCGNSGCHDSPHDNHLFGKKDCEWCHANTNRDFKYIEFNHDKRTKFDLGTGHRKLDCYKCHSKSLGEAKPNGSCEASGCHLSENKHQDRFKAFGEPPRCGTCHTSSTWKQKGFNHGKYTAFNLQHRHAEIACRDCHRGKSPSDFEFFEKRKVGCMGCHEHASVHDKKHSDKECLECHEKPGSPEIKKAEATRAFHGPRSSFPLIKKHSQVACEDCHQAKKNGRTAFGDTPKECGVRCHQDSLHKGSLGQECSRCHSPGQWEAVTFQHDEDTEFVLKGLHKTVASCDDCHPKRVYADTPKECSAAGCHAEDDAHKGRLGRQCDKCHLESGEMIFNHNTQSRYPLEGKHLEVRCADCHPSVTFKPRPVDCFGCHPEPAVHKGAYGTVCEQCHTTATFTDIRPLHDVGDFSLRGAHDNVGCNRCHRDNRPLAGAGNLCVNCHRQDDIHSNSLSPRCGECHTQWAFTPARFDHTRVGCNLTGLHRTMPCYDCHKTGNFGGLSPACGSCHVDEALRQGNDGNHGGVTTCGTCHNPNFWLPATGGGQESVCR